MTYQLPSDLAQQIQCYIQGGGYACEEDVLREALKALDSRDEQLTTIGLQTAISDMEAGDQGRPLREVVDEIRRQHKFSSPS